MPRAVGALPRGLHAGGLPTQALALQPMPPAASSLQALFRTGLAAGDHMTRRMARGIEQPPRDALLPELLPTRAGGEDDRTMATHGTR